MSYREVIKKSRQTYNKFCPQCGSEMIGVHMGIDKIPEYPSSHPMSLWGYRCPQCGFELETPEELLRP